MTRASVPRSVTWTPPDGLERSRPREVRLTASGAAVLVLAGVLGVGAVACVVTFHVKNVLAEQARGRLAAEGVESEATVVRLWREGSKRRETWVQLRWTAGHREYVRATRIGSGEWARLSTGDRLPVRYLASNPERAFLPGHEPSAPHVEELFVLGGPLAFAAGCMVHALRRERRLLAEGRAARGRIVSSRRRGSETVLEYEFTTLSGALVRGRAVERRRRPPVGADTCVIYDPDEPHRRTALYPFVLVRPAQTRSL
jgi:hypothetical protein